MEENLPVQRRTDLERVPADMAIKGSELVLADKDEVLLSKLEQFKNQSQSELAQKADQQKKKDFVTSFLSACRMQLKVNDHYLRELSNEEISHLHLLLIKRSKWPSIIGLSLIGSGLFAAFFLTLLLNNIFFLYGGFAAMFLGMIGPLVLKGCEPWSYFFLKNYKEFFPYEELRKQIGYSKKNEITKPSTKEE